MVFGQSFEEQLYRLDEVFDRLQSAKLKLKPSKCSLFQQSVEFLGHVVSEQGIAMQDEKVSAIRDWPPCQSSFYGTKRVLPPIRERLFCYRRTPLGFHKEKSRFLLDAAMPSGL